MVAAKTLFHPEFLQDPYPTYREFQSAGRIHELEWGPRKLWTIFSYEDCLATLKDQRLSSKGIRSVLAVFSEEERAQLSELNHMLSLWLLNMDAPEHSRLRKLMNKGFSPAAIDILRPQVEAIVNRVIDAISSTSEIDLMPEVAHRLPVIVIGELLGNSPTSQSQLCEWSDAIALFLGNPKRTFEQAAAAQDAIADLTLHFQKIVEERRRDKGDDLISLLLDIEADGEILTEEELYAQCIMLLFAGHETTRNLIGNGIYSLLQHPLEMQKLRDNPDLIRSSVEEMLRYESPVQYMSRITKERTEICGVEIEADQGVIIMLAAANRDPSRFKHPDRFDLGRSNNPHLAFGAGAHFCIGSQLARLEGQTSILRMIQRFPNMKLTNRPPSRVENFVFRGLKSLPIAL